MVNDNERAVIIVLHWLGCELNKHLINGIVLATETKLPYNIKFIFPQAPFIEFTFDKKEVKTAWYDITTKKDVKENEEDDRGLLESIKRIKKIIQKEAEAGIPSRNIFILGLSQGGTLSLSLAVTSEHKLGGFVCIGGFLPYPKIIEKHEIGENKSTPILMSHGQEDKTVDFSSAKESYEILKKKGYRIEFNENSERPEMAHDGPSFARMLGGTISFWEERFRELELPRGKWFGNEWEIDYKFGPASEELKAKIEKEREGRERMERLIEERWNEHFQKAWKARQKTALEKFSGLFSRKGKESKPTEKTVKVYEKEIEILEKWVRELQKLEGALKDENKLLTTKIAASKQENVELKAAANKKILNIQTELNNKIENLRQEWKKEIDRRCETEKQARNDKKKLSVEFKVKELAWKGEKSALESQISELKDKLEKVEKNHVNCPTSTEIEEACEKFDRLVSQKNDLETRLNTETNNLSSERTTKEKYFKNYRSALLRLAAQKYQTKKWEVEYNQEKNDRINLESQKDNLQTQFNREQQAKTTAENNLDHERTKTQQLELERDNWKQKFEEHVCPPCPLKHCPSTHDNYEELLKQESKIVEQLNQELKLGLSGKDKNLEQIITKIKELIAPPRNQDALETAQTQLKAAEQVITDLQKQLADKEQNRVPIAAQKEVIQVVWQEILPSFIYQAVSEEIKQINDYTQLKSLSAKVSQQLSQYQIENKQKEVQAVQSSRNTERFIWISLLLVSLASIGELLRKLRTKNNKC